MPPRTATAALLAAAALGGPCSGGDQACYAREHLVCITGPLAAVARLR